MNSNGTRLKRRDFIALAGAAAAGGCRWPGASRRDSSAMQYEDEHACERRG